MSAEELLAVVTGFEPFDGGAQNASWLAVRELPASIALPGGRLRIHTEELPVTFAGAAARSRELISTLKPDIVIHVGLNARAEGVMLETRAYNLQKASIPDNAGHLAAGEPVLTGGNDVLYSTWAAHALAGRLQARALPAKVSDDAGRYVCNTTLYTALSAVSALPGYRHAGFVHVPEPDAIPTKTVTASLQMLLLELSGQILRHRARDAGGLRSDVPRTGRPLRIGITGGIGSGKSTVAALFQERGARIVDADAIAHQIVEPGSPVLTQITEAFGDDLLDGSGQLKRAELASIVFADPAKRATLEAITLPAIARQAAYDMDIPDPDGTVPAVSVYDVPLLTEGNMADLFDLVVVVESPEELRLQRLGSRGLSRDDALARMASQANDAQRSAIADIIIHNDADRASLRKQVAALWDRLT